MKDQKKEKHQITDQEIEKQGYTKKEIPFADGKGTKLDKAIYNTAKSNNKDESK